VVQLTLVEETPNTPLQPQQPVAVQVHIVMVLLWGDGL
jgi:hypothetical protein